MALGLIVQLHTVLRTHVSYLRLQLCTVSPSSPPQLQLKNNCHRVHALKWRRLITGRPLWCLCDQPSLCELLISETALGRWPLPQTPQCSIYPQRHLNYWSQRSPRWINEASPVVPWLSQWPCVRLTEPGFTWPGCWLKWVCAWLAVLFNPLQTE